MFTIQTPTPVPRNNKLDSFNKNDPIYSRMLENKLFLEKSELYQRRIRKQLQDEINTKKNKKL